MFLINESGAGSPNTGKHYMALLLGDLDLDFNNDMLCVFWSDPFAGNSCSTAGALRGEIFLYNDDILN